MTALGLPVGSETHSLPSPSLFTNEFAALMRQSDPTLKVEILRDLELKVTRAGGGETSMFLHNAYETCKQNPKYKDDILRKFVAAGAETISLSQTLPRLDRTRIVPVIKDRPWLEETRQALISRGGKEMENVYDDLNPDLIILYGEDSPKNIRYFREKDLAEAEIDRAELKALACENLKRLLHSKIQRLGSNGLFILAAGGDYEASLLLIDSVWADLEKEVTGDIIAIPTRDLLIVTGSHDQAGIERMKYIVADATAKGTYRLTTKLFVREAGKFNEFIHDATGESLTE